MHLHNPQQHTVHVVYRINVNDVQIWQVMQDGCSFHSIYDLYEEKSSSISTRELNLIGPSTFMAYFMNDFSIQLGGIHMLEFRLFQ